MIWIYDMAVRTAAVLLRLSTIALKRDSRSKYALFARGQRRLTERIREQMPERGASPVIWFHAASLGEFAVAKPLIARLKAEGACTVVVTFFSSTGYEAVKDRRTEIDRVFYLPLDTKSNVRAFLDAVKPDRAVFIISEYWCNYLRELQRRKIPTFLVSAIIRRDSIFFKWYGGLYRRLLTTYARLFVLDEASQQNLRALGCENVTLSGNPLFDNAAIMARTPWRDPLVERFARGGRVFLAGSISDQTDLELVSRLADAHPEVRFVFVPHEIRRRELDRIREAVKGEVRFYSACDDATDFSTTQVLVVDTVGMLAYLYRYATWAYVGGGFTPLLHSVIEATVYGIPVAFGPRIRRKVTPNELVALRIGRVVSCFEELEQWFSSLLDNEAELRRVRETAANYVARNTGATERIAATIKQGI